MTTWCEKLDSQFSKRGWHKSVAALVFYLILSSAIFLHLMPHSLRTSFIGWGSDQSFFIWCLKWWPYAIAHHLNPFISKFLFVPTGFNLTWSSSAPLMALMALPFTLTLGPVAAYNLLCLLCPALDAWTAFVLCRYLGSGFWPSLVGGWLFGFSPFVVSRVLGGHLALFAVFLLPLMVLLTLMRLEERISARTFTLLTCAILVGEFLTFTETFATMTLMGTIALALGWLFGQGALRSRIQALLLPIELAYIGAVVLVSPYLYYMFLGFRKVPYYSAENYSVNLLNLVVPTKITALWYVAPIFQRLSSSFATDIPERGAYLGVPLLVVAAWFMIEHRQTIASRLCTALLVIAIVLSMGPTAHVGQSTGWTLPWQLFTYVPLLDQALPIRLSVYLSLIVAIVAAMWLTSVRLGLWVRTGVVVLIIVSTFPDISVKVWHTRTHQMPTFFTDKAAYHHYLNRGETVAILPFEWGLQALSMGWQAQTGMYFKMAAGYLAFTPPSYIRWPAVRASVQSAEIPGLAEQWGAFFASHHVSLVVTQAETLIAPHQREKLRQIFSSLGLASINIGGVCLYRIPPEALARYRYTTSLQMETLEDEQRFTISLMAAHHYLADGGNPALLSPDSAAQRGLFPVQWTTQQQAESDFSPWLRSEADGTITVGLIGTYPALFPLIERYGSFAERIFFPHPELLGQDIDALADVTNPHWLVMVFDRAGLDRAVAVAGSQRPKPGEPAAAN